MTRTRLSTTAQKLHIHATDFEDDILVPYLRSCDNDHIIFLSQECCPSRHNERFMKGVADYPNRVCMTPSFVMRFNGHSTLFDLYSVGDTIYGIDFRKDLVVRF
jgi:hypothetical protein